MKLWLISQNENNGWDTYDSAVVAAETEEDARKTHPSKSGWPTGDYHYGTWVTSPDTVTAEYLGIAKEGTAAGVICASFNAG